MRKQNNIFHFLSLLCLLLCWGGMASCVMAQVADTSAASATIIALPHSEQLLHINTERLSLQRTGMTVLAGWAAANMITGAALGFRQPQSRSGAFWQMNMYWNIVNAAIAGFSLYSLADTDAQALSLATSLSDAHSLEKLLMLNIGLDVAYLLAAGWLYERGGRKSNPRLQGFADGLLLQGAFLLVFDTSFLLLHSPVRAQLETFVSGEIYPAAAGVAFTLRFPLTK